MQGVKVGPITAGLLTPESLAELMGGPDIVPVQSNLQTPPGYPNAYNEEPGPLPYIGVAGPPGTDTAAAARTRGNTRSRRTDAGAGVGPAPGPAPGPPLPAEAASAPAGGGQ